jgi:hypothetical protein
MVPPDGHRWYDRRRRERYGPSAGVAVAITAAMFAAAFAAMGTVRVFRSWADDAPVTPLTIRLETPATPRPTPRPHRLTAPSGVPSALPSPAKPSEVSPLVTPGEPVQVAADTSRAAPKPAPTIVPGVVEPPRTGGTTPMAGVMSGAPVAPSGVTIGSRTANTEQYRDSVIHDRMIQVPLLMRTHPPQGRELAELRASQREAEKIARRTTTAGNSADLRVLQGAGMNGTGAVSGPGVVSIGLPLFSSGPSAAQRKKNDSLNTDYWLRMGRLNDRILAARDSARADSLRRDSVAKRKIVPNT